MLNREQAYIEASHAWVPDPYDMVEYPSNLPFYRAWQGVVAAMGVSDYSQLEERFKGLFHNPICWCMGLPIEQQWAKMVEQFRDMVSKWNAPEEPRLVNWGFYESAPVEPTEHDARQFFNQEYKRAFPGKRANSKDANALWLEKKDKAMVILQERHKGQYAAWEQRRDAAGERQAKARQEWIDKFHAQALFEDWVRSL